jgi:hypothetical protein
VPEPFVEDFLEQAFDESQFFFALSVVTLSIDDVPY